VWRACASIRRTGDDEKFSGPGEPIYSALDGNSIDYHDPLQAFKTSRLNPW
jgi:hypothetical protein